MDTKKMTGIPAASRQSPRPVRRYLRYLWDTLTSVKTFLALASALLLACILGSAIPQGQSVAALSESFGVLGRWVIVATGLNDVFHAYWFNALLAALGVNLAACSLKRIRAIRARPAVFLAHAAVLLILSGALIRGLAGHQGTLDLLVGRWANAAEETPRQHFFLPFKVRLDRFSLDYWEQPAHLVRVLLPVLGIDTVEKVRVGDKISLDGRNASLEVLAFYPNFVMTDKGGATRDQQPANPALELAYKRGEVTRKLWVFARFPDMHGNGFEDGKVLYQYVPGNIRQFHSDITILEGEREVLRGSLKVNHPISYKGYFLYQYSYDPSDLSRSILLVARDPGVPVVYTGFALLGIGLVWSFRWRKGVSV